MRRTLITLAILLAMGCTQPPTEGSKPPGDMKMTPMMDGGGMMPVDMKMAAPDLANTTPGMLLWSKRFGGTDTETAYGLTIDKNSNILITGTFTGTSDFGGGPLVSQSSADIFLAKYTPDGSPVWSRRYGVLGSGSNVFDIAVDNNTDAVVVGVSGPIDFGAGLLPAGGLLAKINSLGNLIWAKSFPGIVFTGVATGKDGSIVVSGFLMADSNLGGGILKNKGKFDIVFGKLSPEGNHVWSKTFGTTQDETGGQITVDAAGDIVLTGDLADGTDLGGGPIQVIGAVGKSVGFIAKYTSDGNHTWSKALPVQGGRAYFSRLATDQLNNIAAGCQPSFDGQDVYLSKHSPNGMELWNKKKAPTQTIYGMDVAFDTANRLVVAITCRDMVDFGDKTIDCSGTFNGAIVKFTAEGNYLWHKRTPNSQAIWTRVATDGEQIIVVDTFKDTIDLGDGPLTSIGKGDIVLYKLAP